MRTFDLLEPSTLEEAIRLATECGEDARYLAGGAMLIILLRQRVIAPTTLISLAGIDTLTGLTQDDTGLHIGATTTLRTIERSPLVQSHYPVLAEAARLVGNVRVRNVATVGGHLAQADVHLDLPPVLLALGATVSVAGAAGPRVVDVADLLVGYYETSLRPGEVITGLHLPPAPAGLHGAYLKFCSLSPNDWPTVGAAAFLRAVDGRAQDVRVVVGSVSDRPLRLPEAEALVEGSRLTTAGLAEVGRRYGAAADPLPDVRGSADYKRQVTGVFVQRALAAAAARAGLTVAG